MCFIVLPLLQFAENPSTKRKQTIPLSSTFGQPAFQPNLWPILEAQSGRGATMDEVTRSLRRKLGQAAKDKQSKFCLTKWGKFYKVNLFIN